MATLKSLTSGELAVLRPRHVIGRNRTDVHLYIGDSDISRHHAYLYWQDQAWLLRDVSSNGIWVGGKRIHSEQAVVIHPGDAIRFGRQEHNTWVVLDAAAPRNSLMPISHGGPDIPLGPYTALPAEDPVLEIIHEAHGRWLLRRDDQSTTLIDGQCIEFDGETWQANLLPDSLDNQATEKITRLGMDGMQLQFRVSQDEEHVHLLARLDNDQPFDFGERIHHYLLLTLARQRHQDWQRGLDEATQGWLDMEPLCAMLGMEASHVNIQIHRARKQLKELLIGWVDTSDLIERRVGGVRLRCRRFQIYRGSRLEASLPPPSEDDIAKGGNTDA